MRSGQRGLGIALVLIGVGAIGACAEVLGLEEASLDPEFDAGEPPEGGCAVSPDLDPDLVASCVLGISCDPLAPEQSISDCITRAALPAPCLAGALNCANVRACTGVQREAFSVCDGRESGWHCEENVAIRCLDGSAYSVNCVILGGTCVLPVGNESEPPCLLPESATCSDHPDGSYCSGDFRYTCLDGAAYGVDCTSLSLECHEDEPGDARCVRIGPSCTQPDTVSCSGDVVEECGPASRLTAFDCSLAGGSCETAGPSTAYCLSPGCTRQNADSCEEECGEEATLWLCVGGARYEVDCRAHGLSECVRFTERESGEQRVSCR